MFLLQMYDIYHPGANHNNDYHDNNNSSAINRGRQRHRHNTCTGGTAKEVDLLRGGVASHVGQEQEGGAQRRVDGGGEQVHSQGDDARLPHRHHASFHKRLSVREGGGGNKSKIPTFSADPF